MFVCGGMAFSKTGLYAFNTIARHENSKYAATKLTQTYTEQGHAISVSIAAGKQTASHRPVS